jgi:hypothetical protein
MKAIQRPVEEGAAYYVLPINGNVILENVMTVFCHGNRRAARVVDLGGDEIESILQAGLVDIDEWRGLKTRILMSAGQAAQEAASGSKSSMLDTRRWLDPPSMEHIRKLVYSFIADRGLQRDVGACLLQAIKQCPSWTTEFCMAPSLGYPRERLRLKEELNFEAANATYPWLQMPSPTTAWSMGIAEALMLADKPRFGERLIPAIEQKDKPNPRDIPLGAVQAFIKMLDKMQGLAALYLLQGPLLYLHMHERLFTAAYDLTYAIEEKHRPLLEFIKAAWSEIKSAVPLHPILAAVASATASGSLDGDLGTKDLLYRWGPAGSYNVSKGKFQNYCKPKKGAMIDAVINAALDDGEEGHIFALPDGTVSLVCEADYRWGWQSTVNIDGEEVPKRWYGLGEFIRILKGSPELISAAAETAAILNWRSGGAVLNIDTLDAVGCEFTLCDGEMYSKDPGAGVAGYSPVLSKANTKLLGLDLRFDQSWNTHPRITHSVMVVKGYQGANNTSNQYERGHIPAGMTMGEPWVDWVQAVALPDGVGQRILKHWEDKVSVYIRPGYRDLTDIPKGSGVVQTDWDPWCVEDEETKARMQWILALEENDEADTAKPPLMLTTEAGHVFYHRVPVKISHQYAYEIFDELGGFIESRQFAGFVVFDHELSMPKGSDTLEAIVNLQSPIEKTGAAAVDEMQEKEAIVQ